MKLIAKKNFILTLCVLALVVLCFLSVYSPMRFEEKQAAREREVKERLVSIRQAEEQYRKQHGTYTGDFAALVNEGFLADSLTYIPYSDGKRFELSATVVEMTSGIQEPRMECGAQYQQYLDGMDENTISNLIETANKAGKYPGLRIGGLEEANNNAGNWE